MFTFIAEKLITYYPAVGVYSVVLLGIIFITYKITLYYVKINTVVSEFPTMKQTLNRVVVEVEKIPRMEKLLEKIDRGLSALNHALLEKNILNQSYHSHK